MCFKVCTFVDGTAIDLGRNDDVNNIEKEMQSIAEFLKPLNISKVELLPYHKMGEHKFAALNYDFIKFNTPGIENINKLNLIFGSCGL